jgi:hypothetical protein
MSDREFLERAWALASLPMAHVSYAEAVHALLADGDDRALLMFEFAVEIAAMRDGSLQALLTAWTRSQFLAPSTITLAGAA